MPKLSGINHLQAVKAFEKIGFTISRQSKRVIMTDGMRILTIPSTLLTMGGIIRDAGLTIEEFKQLL